MNSPLRRDPVPGDEPATPAPISRRDVLRVVAGAPLVLSGCAGPGATPGPAARTEQFSVAHDGRNVRCLYHLRRSPAGGGPLAVIALHGANADATQWFDIGLVAAIEGLVLTGAVRSVVGVAVDIADYDRAASLVIDAVLPGVVDRFGPSWVAISGISRGAIAVLAAGRRTAGVFGSVGLHSPAIRLVDPIPPVRWRCWIDVGMDDPLADAAGRTAASLRASGVDVTQRQWPGGHGRSYWRAHLPDYLAFHVDTAEKRPR